jgi:hypothetical protein
MNVVVLVIALIFIQVSWIVVIAAPGHGNNSEQVADTIELNKTEHNS